MDPTFRNLIPPIIEKSQDKKNFKMLETRGRKDLSNNAVTATKKRKGVTGRRKPVKQTEQKKERSLLVSATTSREQVGKKDDDGSNGTCLHVCTPVT